MGTRDRNRWGRARPPVDPHSLRNPPPNAEILRPSEETPPGEPQDIQTPDRGVVVAAGLAAALVAVVGFYQLFFR